MKNTREPIEYKLVFLYQTKFLQLPVLFVCITRFFCSANPSQYSLLCCVHCSTMWQPAPHWNSQIAYFDMR